MDIASLIKQSRQLGFGTEHYSSETKYFREDQFSLKNQKFGVKLNSIQRILPVECEI